MDGIYLNILESSSLGLLLVNQLVLGGLFHSVHLKQSLAEHEPFTKDFPFRVHIANITFA